MTADTPPAQSADGQQDADPSEGTPSNSTDEPPSLIGRLLGWSGGAAEDEAESTEPAQLGPAFRKSSPAELAMVTNILRLRDLRVEDVLTPRADISGVSEDAELVEVIDTFKDCSLSRLPVFRETLDDPQGFVHLKDLALNYGFDATTDAENFKLSDHIRPAIFVPPSMRIAALLQKMQHERVHMALVIDEFGGVDGLVTIEDLVEQIVGDIEDEHDTTDDAAWTKEPSGTWLIQARADIQEFQGATGLKILLEEWEEEVDTLGGLVFMLANRVPTRGEVILHPEGYEIEIVDADARRIKRLRLRDGNGSAAIGQAAE